MARQVKAARRAGSRIAGRRQVGGVPKFAGSGVEPHRLNDFLKALVLWPLFRIHPESSNRGKSPVLLPVDKLNSRLRPGQHPFHDVDPFDQPGEVLLDLLVVGENIPAMVAEIDAPGRTLLDESEQGRRHLPIEGSRGGGVRGSTASDAMDDVPFVGGQSKDAAYLRQKGIAVVRRAPRFEGAVPAAGDARQLSRLRLGDPAGGPRTERLSKPRYVRCISTCTRSSKYAGEKEAITAPIAHNIHITPWVGSTPQPPGLQRHRPQRQPLITAAQIPGELKSATTPFETWLK
ncbi:hypothetical protein BN159_7729 [Streptomyces davaonensis JCM 4913]|uniref:Uncharacterized protein n=1 Tax=Streptomyces davaonensis (strain DSM 101723 / JCM 4913 / KCC S-0913 / 768) TaxID=1214101 RepID=K4RE97_STRDJ|nr:hypothetical protein BN159_7729 [Streptomyces davaonensis JCM 4913]